MNAAHLTGMRKTAETLTTSKKTYRLLDGNGRVIMFGIDKERADEFARYYKGGKVVNE